MSARDYIPDPAQSRATMVRRDALRRQAQSVLYVNDGRPFNKQHRTCWCSRHVVNDGPIPVFRRNDGAKARFGQVKTCGSVWACPVCAAKIAEQRRRELTHAMNEHVKAGGYAYLVTFTFPHYRHQALAELLPKFDEARAAFQRSKRWRKLMLVPGDAGSPGRGSAGRVGSVTSAEVKYGTANGWHPHLHMLVFCQPNAFGELEPDVEGRLSSAVIDTLRAEWVHRLEKVGLVDGSNRQHAMDRGFDVRGGAKAAEYIAKWGHEEQWGLSRELTRGHAKTGKREAWGDNEHYTPFQLLDLSAGGDGHATCAFREYVDAFDGKRMLTWSPGLKAHFAIAELSDEDAAAEGELPLGDEQQVGKIEQEQLTKLVSYGLTGEFLAYVAEYGYSSDFSQAHMDEWIAARGGGDEGAATSWSTPST